MTEVPSYERSRAAGVSKLNTFRDGWRVLGTILRERCAASAIDRAAMTDFAVPATPAIKGVNEAYGTSNLSKDLQTRIRHRR